MVANRKSLRESAKILGISIDELKSYFEYDQFEIPFIENIIEKLSLQNIVDIPNAITPAALDLIEWLEARIKKQQKIIDLKDKIINNRQRLIEENQKILIDQLDKMLELYVIIESRFRKEYHEKNMEENYQYIRKLLVEHRGYSF